jgi:predicted Zn finger-like uncharacterized protein
MVIQCEKCQTRFKLNENKIPEQGAKVRCAKCRHIFRVFRPEPEQVSEQIQKAPLSVPVAPAVPEPVTTGFDDQPASFESGHYVSADADQPPAFQATTTSEDNDTSFYESDFSFGQADFPAAETAPEKASSDQFASLHTESDTTDFDTTFGAEETASSTEPVADAVSFDFDKPTESSLAYEPEANYKDFGSAEPEPASSATEFPPPQPEPYEQGKQDFSFGFDGEEPTTAPQAPGLDFTNFDFPDDKSSTTTTGGNLDLSELDFSKETDPVRVDVSSRNLSGPIFSPFEETVTTEAPAGSAPDTGPELDALLPPPLTTRRSQGSAFSALIIIVTLIVLAVLGYLIYNFIGGGSKALSIFGKQTAVVEEGRIDIRNVEACYIEKAEAGELLVITGDAVNSFKTARATLQVRAVVLAANNQHLATKTAYAGNILTNEQLAEMPADKIEAAMNNQFGDSLTNLEVLPGKSIPFVIVFIDPPEDGKDYSVTPLGSTVAASK